MQQDNIIRKLRVWQSKLLDLSHANRLLYFKPSKTGNASIIFPEPDELLQQLVVKGRTLTFPLPIERTLFDIDSSESEPATTATITRRYRSGEIGSDLPDQQLSKVLYNLRARARSAMEEQGVNVLFLTLGMLEWKEAVNTEPVRSPLLLIPVELSREALREPYRLTMLEDDIVLNPTLIHKLETDFKLSLPELTEDWEDQGLASFLDRVQTSILRQPDWQVVNEAHLGIFSFQKLILHQDLERHQASFAAHPIIKALAGIQPLTATSTPIDADSLDKLIPPATVYQVVDADSSQQEAIEAAKRGISFVLQGPPGTGKSQTITNIIAEFLAGGKRVLFVSEKMAALEVVQKRLNDNGLGEFCLQLHSHKRDKREVIDELVQALDAPMHQISPESQVVLQDLETTRASLNSFVRALHTPRFALQWSAFRAHGYLAKLLDVDTSLPQVSVGDVTRIDHSEWSVRLGLVEQLAGLPEVIDGYEVHPWRGVTLQDASFGLRDQIGNALGEALRLLPQYESTLTTLAHHCGLRPPSNLAETENLLKILQVYKPGIFELDLDLLSVRLEKRYRAFYRSLLPGYRSDVSRLKSLRLASDSPNYHKFRHEVAFVLRVKQELKPEGEPNSPRPSITTELPQQAITMAKKIKEALSSIAQLYGGTLPNLGELPPSRAKFSDLSAWLRNQRNNLAALTDWINFHRIRQNAAEHELGSFIEAALQHRLLARHWPTAYRIAFYKAFIDAATMADEALRNFDSRNQLSQIERFRALDRQQLRVARARIKALLSAKRPKNSWVDAPTAEQTILKREAAKKRRIKPLRRLFGEIPRLILDLKPCLLMSPLTVSMLLDPKLYEFDLVIFDEASQIAPEDAAGALLRGRQAIIVGDRQQLPPTRFFASLAEDEVDDDDLADEGVFDSILEECEGANLPQKMLLWHYRSRHESLIAFSNYHFYHNRLYTFPSAQQSSQELGVSFVHVPDGVYRRGKAHRRNDIEARRVVDLIFEHFAQSPKLSLGVVAFSQAQQDAIRVEWERRCWEQPRFEQFFDEDAKEAFFIKNLETVQGDERDVIIFSVGYGRDEAGKLTLNFGPVNRAGGERRLNVAVSRASYQVKLVSSLVPEDIDLARTSSNGARLLRQYMEIARDGLKALYADTTVQANAEFDSPFEQAVHDSLVAKGLVLHLQVGVSGYRIDLAVVDPHNPGQYLLGIECDGATYHSAHTARDRDRLRQQVLEGLGWKIHRIWSRDWLNNREREIEKVMMAIEAVRTSNQRGDRSPRPAVTSTQEPDSQSFLRTVPAVRLTTGNPTNTKPYVQAKLAPRHGSIVSVASSTLANDIVTVVEAEGPIHRQVLYQRLATAWGNARVGPRIREAIDLAIYSAELTRKVEAKGEFLWSAAMRTPTVRTASSQGTRKIEYIAPEELVEAVYLCVAEARSLSVQDLTKQVGRLVGVGRVTATSEQIIQRAITSAHVAKRIVLSDDTVRLP